MTKVMIIVAAVFCTASSVLSSPPTTRPTVVAVRETRMIEERGSKTTSGSLTMVLSFDQLTAVDVLAAGELKILAAEDDTGRSLVPGDSDGLIAALGRRRARLKANILAAEQVPGGAFRLPVPLLASNRKAVTVKSVKGQFSVMRGGPVRTVRIPIANGRVSDLRNGAMSVAILTGKRAAQLRDDAGITDGTSICIELKANEGFIVDVSIRCPGEARVRRILSTIYDGKSEYFILEGGPEVAHGDLLVDIVDKTSTEVIFFESADVTLP